MTENIQNSIIKKLIILYSAQAQVRNKKDHISQSNSLNNLNEIPSLRQLEALSLINTSTQSSITQLSSMLSISKPAVSRLVNKLEINQLITLTFGQDKRQKVIQLTPQGKLMAEQHDQLHAEAVKKYLSILNNFDTSELLAIEKFIDALNQNLDN